MTSTSAAATGLPGWRSDRFRPPDGYERLRDAAPVTRIELPGGGARWLVTRYSDARAVLADPRFSSRVAVGTLAVRDIPEEFLERQRRPGQLILSDPPEHTRYRRLLAAEFAPRRIHTLAGAIEEIVNGLLDSMRMATGPVDLMRALAFPVPTLVICELLGVPHSDHEQFQRWSAALVDLNSTALEMFAATESLDGYLQRLIENRRGKPGGDLLSRLIATTDPAGPLTDVELKSILMLVLIGGYETTADAIGLSTFWLLQSPARLAALQADPRLVRTAVDEFLRYLSIINFGLVRLATEDLEVGGQLIPAGELVVVSLDSANHDPHQFGMPERFDARRAPNRHLTFGHGAHQCLGQHLARLELTITLTRLIQRFPALRLAAHPDEVRTRDDLAVYGVHELPVRWKW
jgi:cytochrome P450